MWPDFGKPTFWYKQDFWENSNISALFFEKNNYILNLVSVKFHTHSFFLLGDMDVYTRPCSNLTYVGQQLINKLGNLFRCWNG